MQKHAVITGGGTGIGLATARKLALSGYHVTALGLGEPETLAEGISYQELDVGNETAVQALFAGFERIDALVNAAGIIDHTGEWQRDGFSRVIDINLTSVLSVTNAALPALRHARGAVVNFASMWSFFGSPKTPAYASSKAAIGELTRCMAVAWAADGVRANAVAPGWILTNLARRAFEDAERSAGIIKRIPAGRWGNPEDVADVIAFLVSDSARYVTGTTLPVDGGYSIA
ncbi:SDR family NAD(P)-dependent oxidoreductase [Ensifer sp. YR511]|uniref:SDR family NAD(P)-dependent oxidoreductase n=1 Tax=Ensifer sp. YR511 TaxID=1855294 RepID=UPI000882AC8B|nr:SDR family oxidoreductase [Ensifer sp. YR511]SDN03665.1 NAD(P)-dependent dehydrogenase, short-chain alcohol dehydrogenase family [Ensifer sp. YR511]